MVLDVQIRNNGVRHLALFPRGSNSVVFKLKVIYCRVNLSLTELTVVENVSTVSCLSQKIKPVIKAYVIQRFNN